MEQGDRLRAAGECELSSVSVTVSGSAVSPALVSSLFAAAESARKVADLHSSLLSSVRALSQLDVYRRCSVVVTAGSEASTAVVNCHLRMHPPLRFLLFSSGNHEGGSVAFGGVARNLRRRADITRVATEWKPNTSTWGVALSHSDPMLWPGKLATVLETRCREIRGDPSILSRESAQSLSLAAYDKSLHIRLSRCLRVNFPDLNTSGSDLLSSSLLSSEKYALSLTLRSDTRNSVVHPTDGRLVECTVEAATVQGTALTGLDATGKWLFSLMHRGVVAELAANWQWVEKWGSGKWCYNDRLRGAFVKGFQAFGERKAVEKVDGGIVDRVGDSIGTTSILSLEGKLHFRDFPVLHHLSVTPFVYLNLLACPSLRGSCGFGLDWTTHYGRIELSYAARTVSRCGDIPARLQLLLYD